MWWIGVAQLQRVWWLGGRNVSAHVYVRACVCVCVLDLCIPGYLAPTSSVDGVFWRAMHILRLLELVS